MKKIVGYEKIIIKDKEGNEKELFKAILKDEGCGKNESRGLIKGMHFGKFTGF